MRSWSFPLSYYFAKKREADPTARETRDAVLKDKIMKEDYQKLNSKK